MYRFIEILIVVFCFGFGTSAQSLIGAWEGYSTSASGEKLRNVVIFSDGYQVLSTYNAQTGAFIHSNGGSYSLEGTTMTEVVEFHTDDTSRIGKSTTFDIILTDQKLSIVGHGLELNKIDSGGPGELQGSWLMSGRVRDGKTQNRDTSRPRKTMKVLSGTRFQWIAYNTETKEFKGAGGGTYTTIDGKYTETIEFFSRDDSRVGMSLEFDYDIINGDWHHSGLSSKGNPIHEIWSVRTPEVAK